MNSAFGFFHRRVAMVCGVLLVAAALAACKSHPKVADCANTKSTYLRAQDHALLQTPAGLEAPDQRNNLTVPPPTTAAAGKTSCLDHPPSYFGTAGRIAASPDETIADWAQAWADRNVDAVIAMYSSKFGSDGTDTTGTAILEQRRAEVANGPAASGRVKNLRITQPDPDRRIARLIQVFGTNAVQKELQLVRESGVWKIASEKVVTVNADEARHEEPPAGAPPPPPPKR